MRCTRDYAVPGRSDAGRPNAFTPPSRGVTYTALAGAAVVTGMMAWTALLGGRVRHTEVRPGATEADALKIEPRRPPGPRPDVE